MKAKLLVSNLMVLKNTRPLAHDHRAIVWVKNTHMDFKNTRKDSSGFDTCVLDFYALELSFRIFRNSGGQMIEDNELTTQYSALLNALIYDLLPVFKRYNLICGIYYGTKYILDQGLKPSYLK